MQADEVEEVLSQALAQELLRRDVARLAFVGKDRTPWVIAIGILWNGTEFVMCTAKSARKLRVLGTTRPSR